MNKEEFIIKCAACCNNAKIKQYGLLPSVFIAQAILESGWGESELAINANNFHGLNHYNDSVTKHYQIYVTKVPQEHNGVITWNYENMCRFYSMLESFQCLRDWYLMREKYKPIINEPDYKKVTEFLTGKYATSSIYGGCLNRIIQEYDLTQYDDDDFTIQYYVQAGAFYDKIVAKNFIDALKSEGFSAIAKFDGRIIRIQAGAFSDKTYAIMLKDKLIDYGHSAIIKNNIEGVEVSL